MASELTRLTVNLIPRAVAAMESAATRTGDSRTDTVNRALQVYDLVLDLTEKGGGRLRVANADGTIEHVTIV